MVFSTKVNLKQGTVIGGESVLPNGKRYHFFKGIPYAVPPLGELRFKAPVPLEKFAVPELICIKEGPMSLQQDRVTGKISTGSEDCLYLNVYTPESSSEKPLPVMVNIHGGGFLTGNGNTDKHNPLYLLQEEVVVITSNYRLGVLGFLCLPEAGIPGNAGLKDQLLVMQWVKENISQFNGDPNNITLFGHSSGGSSVHMHLFSARSRKLFNKAIMQSGVMCKLIDTDEQPEAKTKNLAKLLGCTSNDPHDILKFLQKFENLDKFIKPTEEFNYNAFENRGLPAKPVIETESSEAMITKNAFDAMSEPNSIQVPVLMGYTNAEGLGQLGDFGENLENFHNDFCSFIPFELNLPLDDPKRMELANSIKEFYFKGHTTIDKTMIYQLCDLLSDFKFASDIRLAAEFHSRFQLQSPLYFYRFDFDGQLNLYKRKFNATHLKGASHVDELCYVFQMEFGPPEPWEAEAHKMVLVLCKMWTNFAKYSNPTPPIIDNDLIGCIWEPVPKVDNWKNLVIKTLIIDKEIKMMSNPDEERMTFWRNLIKTIHVINNHSFGYLNTK